MADERERERERKKERQKSRQNDEKIGFGCRQEKYLLRARSAFCNPQIMPPKRSHYKHKNKNK